MSASDIPTGRPMSDDELLGLIETEVRQSIGFYQGKLAEQRRKALSYYYGEPYGNEQEGRSAVVTRDVADTVEWILPHLIKIFLSQEEIVRFDPQGPQDEAAAAQATDYINYLFSRLNNGFVALYSFFKDALLQKNGFIKVYWENYEEPTTETYQGLQDLELVQIIQQLETSGDEIEILEHSTSNGLHGIQVLIKGTKGRLCIDPVPPEEVLVNKRAPLDLQKCRFVAHRSKRTRSEMRAMGFDMPDGLDDYSEAEYTLERIERYKYEEESVYQVYDNTDESMRELWVTEAYPLVDFDGDGIAERRLVFRVGKHLLRKTGESEVYNVRIDRVPLVTCTPIIMPHKLFGLSVWDLIQDLQLIKSTIFRQILDNMYLTNNSRVQILDGMVNIDDLLTVRPGGVVRTKSLNAITPLVVPQLGAPAFELLGYVDKLREERTGARYFQGVDPNALNSQVSGIAANTILQAAAVRIELIARVFAETGVKDLFWSMLELVQKHTSEPQIVRLRGQWVTVDPREWKTKFDMTVSVGLGTGSQAIQIQGMQLVLNSQLQAVQAGGMGLIVTPQNVYNALNDLAMAVNPKKAGAYFTNPQGQMPQPKPDPKIQAGLQKAAMQDKTKRDVAGVDFLARMAELAQKAKEHQSAQAHDINMAGLDLVTQGLQQAGDASQPQTALP